MRRRAEAVRHTSKRGAEAARQVASASRSTALYGLGNSSYGAGVAAFQRSTIDAVVVLSVLLNPGTGAFEYRSR
jgi:hypothetical protein